MAFIVSRARRDWSLLGVYMLAALKYNNIPVIFAPIAQLDRVLDYESRGREFESLWARQTEQALCAES